MFPVVSQYWGRRCANISCLTLCTYSSVVPGVTVHMYVRVVRHQLTNVLRQRTYKRQALYVRTRSLFDVIDTKKQVKMTPQP